MTNIAYYLAYYELHEIPWKLDEAIKLEARPLRIQLQIGRGPYRIPKPASPTIVTRAGGARVETVNENYVLEGSTYFGVAIPLERGWPNGSPLPMPEWNKPAQLADDAASVVGLCLDQRTGLKKVAEYIREHREDSTAGRMEFRWQMFAGPRAAISKRSSRSLVRAMNHLLNNRVSPQTLVALRWYEQSKRVIVGADRFLALWVALEALMAPVKGHADLVRKTGQYLSHKEFRFALDAEGITQALGLRQLRRLRNEIIHEGARLAPWPVSDDPSKRDWPQILSDIVAEVLRYRLRATLTRSLDKHIQDGLRVSSGPGVA